MCCFILVHSCFFVDIYILFLYQLSFAYILFSLPSILLRYLRVLFQSSYKYNPWCNPLISRILDGIERVNAPRELAIKRSKEKEEPLWMTTDLLAQVTPLLIEGHTSRRYGPLMTAAAHAMVYGLLRPNELLAKSIDKPERAILMENIIFKSRSGMLITPSISRLKVDIYSLGVERVILDLGITKTDQAGNYKPVEIYAETPIKYLWQWMCMRMELQADKPKYPKFAFIKDDGKPLTWSSLVQTINKYVTSLPQNESQQRISGKSFRRGGAATLMSNGTSTEQAAVLGRWKRTQMVGLYAGDIGRQAAHKAASLLMDPNNSSSSNASSSHSSSYPHSRYFPSSSSSSSAPSFTKRK